MLCLFILIVSLVWKYLLLSNRIKLFNKYINGKKKINKDKIKTTAIEVLDNTNSKRNNIINFISRCTKNNKKYTGDKKSLMKHLKNTYSNYDSINNFPVIKKPEIKYTYDTSVPTYYEINNIFNNINSTSKSYYQEGITKLQLRKNFKIRREFIQIYQSIWRKMFYNSIDLSIPYDIWNKYSIYLLYKGNGSTDDISNFRPIANIKILVKYFDKLIINRMCKYIIQNNLIPYDLQKAYRCNVNGCFENNYLLNAVLYDSHINKKSISITFLDIKNAFGSISHDFIKYMLDYYSFPPEIKEYFTKKYENLVCEIEFKKSRFKFKQRKGILQGCPTSSMIFILCLNIIIKNINDKYNKNGYQLLNKDILFLCFADDIVLITKSLKTTREILNELNNQLNKFKLFLNFKKCKFYSNEKGALVIENQEITHLDSNKEFKYLGRKFIDFESYLKDIKDYIEEVKLQIKKNAPKDIINKIIKIKLINKLMYQFKVTLGVEFFTIDLEKRKELLKPYLEKCNNFLKDYDLTIDESLDKMITNQCIQLYNSYDDTIKEVFINVNKENENKLNMLKRDETLWKNTLSYTPY